MNKAIKYILLYFTSMTGMACLLANNSNIWTGESEADNNSVTITLGEKV